MQRVTTVAIVTALAACLTGCCCEEFARFEAYKNQALFGCPWPYHAPPTNPFVTQYADPCATACPDPCAATGCQQGCASDPCAGAQPYTNQPYLEQPYLAPTVPPAYSTQPEYATPTPGPETYAPVR